MLTRVAIDNLSLCGFLLWPGLPSYNFVHLFVVVFMPPNKCRKGKLIVRTASAPVTLSFIDYARLLPVLTYLLRDMYGLSNPSVNFRESRLVREGWGGG